MSNEYQPTQDAGQIEHASDADIMQPQDGNASGAEVVSPQEDTKDVEHMTDEEFAEYIDSAKNGAIEPRQAQPGNTGSAVPAEAEEDEPKAEEPFMMFATEADLQAYQDKTIGKRLQEIREREKKASEMLDRAFGVAKEYYGAEDGEAALDELLRDLQGQNADRQGVSVEELENRQALERDAHAFREQQKKENEINAKTGEILEDWQRQEKSLQKIVPDFNMQEALSNPAFYKKVVEEGFSFSEAYMLLEKENKKVVPMPQPKRRAIQEAGAQRTAMAGSIRKDVGTMNDREFEEYIRHIQNR